jgi:hypothetical protein
MSGRSENTSSVGNDPARSVGENQAARDVSATVLIHIHSVQLRPPLMDSPVKRNFDSNITPSSTPPPLPPKDADTLPSPLVKTFQDENTATLPVSKPANVYQHGSIGRNTQRLKKLPSLHEIGKVYIENGGSPVNRCRYCCDGLDIDILAEIRSHIPTLQSTRHSNHHPALSLRRNLLWTDFYR